MGIELVKNKEHIIIKRDGTEEQFSWKKLNKVIKWAVTYKTGISEDNAKFYIDTIKKNLTIRINDRISIIKLYDELIDVTANLVSRMYPMYDLIARNLYIQKIYKDTWNMKRNEYIDYHEVIKKGIKYKVYSKKVLDTFTHEEIEEIGTYIDPEADFNFTFAGLQLFCMKYIAKYSKTRDLELPQHRFMAVAIQLHYTDDKSVRLKNIKKRYDMMKNHEIATATPIMLNALKPVFNATSCVLIEGDDDSESIMEAARSVAIYSKHASGIGLNMSAVRSVGSSIGIEGICSGIIPFAKIYESVISAFNQQNKRPGSLTFYYAWWHYEAPEIIMLKDAGGNEDNRARKLKYCIISNKFFLDAVKENKDVYLFDPKDTPDLLDAYGEKFEELYEHYSNKTGIRKRSINARELFYVYAKVYVETGNNYYFSKDNANKFNMSKDVIRQGNLCSAEVLLPTKPLKVKTSKIHEDFETKELTEHRTLEGEIGICNLTSINLIKWDEKSDSEKDEFIYTLLVGMDNAIEHGDYPVKLGETFNKTHRAIGIGITNYHNFLASKSIKFTDIDALKVTHEIMEDIFYYVLKNSNRLAKERSAYKNFKGSKWSKGILPFELYEEHFNKSGFSDLNFEYKHDWEQLRQDIIKYGVRFEYHMAIPPGACQVKSNKIIVSGSEKTIKDILIEGDIDYKKIEEEGLCGWYQLSKLVSVKTRYGYIGTDKVYYNGKFEVYEIKFKDSNERYRFTDNHKLLCSDTPDIEDSWKWKDVSLIRPGFDYVKNANGKYMLVEHCLIQPEEHTWDISIPEHEEYCLSNGAVSHNTSSAVMNMTEGIEPIRDFIIKKEGTYNVTYIVPNLKEHGKYYETAWKIPYDTIIRLAAVRQKFLDQSQSLNIYVKNPDSAFEIYDIVNKVESYGLKSLYYFNSLKKDETEEVCESCAV